MKRLLFCASFAVLLTSPLTVSGDGPSPQRPPVLLKMVRDAAVQEELGLSSPQVSRVEDALGEVDGRWWRSRIQPPAKQQAEIDGLTAQLKRRLGEILDPQQRGRLSQLERQALGTRMFLNVDVADAMALSASQRQRLAEAYQKTDSKTNDIQQQQMRGEIGADAAQAAIADLQAAERRAVVDVLSQPQQAKIGELTGEGFNFAQLQRTFPRAPEFESKGATWLKDGPLDLAELRGNVVAVHFYAFQCINCQRNFPHYRAWHEDYADDGLVVVGIQTPETSAERDIERVRAAMKKDDFGFPVLMDGESANWQAWGNTMWPTVYLIDKQGYIRRWWQGELNWKGTPGEQQMRSTIEKLLAEEA